MIIDKRSRFAPEPKEHKAKAVENPPVVTPTEPDENAELYEGNPLSDIYRAIETILKDLRVDPNNPDSPPLFRTIKLNSGQLARIKGPKYNEEYTLAFPAVFVHLINIRWLVQTSRIGEGRADLRICFVLNRLNTMDDEYQTEGYEVFQRVHNAIETRKHLMAPLTERCQLTYFDQVENFDDGLQQFWITYEVWFKNYSTYKYKDYVDRYIVMPPFTNHGDQLPENNQDGHDDHDDPKFEDVSGFTS